MNKFWSQEFTCAVLDLDHLSRRSQIDDVPAPELVVRVVGYGDRRRSGALLAVRSSSGRRGSLRLLGDVDPRAVERSDRETARVNLPDGVVNRQRLKTGTNLRGEENAGSGDTRRKGDWKRTMGRVVLTKV